MLSESEKNFIQYWESVRIEQSAVMSKLIRGLPMACLFSMPVFFSIALVYFFSDEWYTKIAQSVSGSITMILIAIILIVCFFAYMRMQFNWEKNEQIYLELKQKEKSMIQ